MTRTPNMNPTSKQQRVFDFIRGCIESNGEAPTMAEIGRHFQMSSSASVHSVLKALEAKNLIKRTPNISRGITIITEPAETK